MALRERRVERGPACAGIELAAGAVRAIVGRREDGRLHVLGSETVAVGPGAIVSGLAVDRPAVTAALASALQSAEGRERAARIVVALDGDDVRTYHLGTTFERPAESEPVAAAELARAIRESREDAARVARQAAADDPALRGVATVQLRDDVAGFSVDGRAFDDVEGFHGRFVEVRVDVSLAPLLHAGAATAVLDAARRRGTATSGAYALARLLAGAGLTDGGVLRVGEDVTAYALVRDGRVVASRVFGLGRAALLARGAAPADAQVWARCVLAPLSGGGEGEFPARWSFVGVPDALVALPHALADALVELRGGTAEIAPLKPSAAGRVATDAPLHADYLVAAGAAALAADLYQ